MDERYLLFVADLPTGGYMEILFIFVATSGWVVALGALIFSIRVFRRGMDASETAIRVRYVAREFLRSAREIEDLVSSGRPVSPHIANAMGMMRMAFFDLSLDADTKLRDAADRYQEYVVRLVAETAAGRAEDLGDRVARSACAIDYVKTVETCIRRGEFEGWPHRLAHALDRRAAQN